MKDIDVPFLEYVKDNIEADSVVMACGLPATNKTETMEAIARIRGHTILRTDLIRKELMSDEDIFDPEKAADMSLRLMVYDEMFRRALAMAREGAGVILDATFVTRKLRRRAAEVAHGAGRTLVIQQTSCPEDYCLDKISKRTKENYESNALTPEAYYNNAKKWEDVDLDGLLEAYPGLRVAHIIVSCGCDEEDGWRVVGEDVRSA